MKYESSKNLFLIRSTIERTDFQTTVSLEELKRFLKIDFTKHDDILTHLILYVQNSIEHYLKLVFTETAIQDKLIKKKEETTENFQCVHSPVFEPIKKIISIKGISLNELKEKDLVFRVEQEKILLNTAGFQEIIIEYICFGSSKINNLKWVVLSVASMLYKDPNSKTKIRKILQNMLTH